jgi:hypothetical protein
MSSPDATALPTDRVLPTTRILSIAISPFLLAAFVLLYFWPSANDTGRLFAWRIIPPFTAMVLAAVYLGGAYFFFRAARARYWHTISAGFLSVGLFASLMGIATILHWSLFLHTNVAFWLWAGLQVEGIMLTLVAIAVLRAPEDFATSRLLTWLFAVGFVALAAGSVILFARMQRRAARANAPL